MLGIFGPSLWGPLKGLVKIETLLIGKEIYHISIYVIYLEHLRGAK